MIIVFAKLYINEYFLWERLKQITYNDKRSKNIRIRIIRACAVINSKSKDHYNYCLDNVLS